MLDPFLVEQRFQIIVQTLSVDSGERTQLLRIAEFLELLVDTNSRDYLEAYSSELLDHLCPIVLESSKGESSYPLLERIFPVMETLEREYPMLKRPASFGLAMQRLRDVGLETSKLTAAVASTQPHGLK